MKMQTTKEEKERYIVIELSFSQKIISNNGA